MYKCVYIGLQRVQIWENAISGQVFFWFFGPLTPPLTHLIKAIWVFFVPMELFDILVINKKFGVIYWNGFERSWSNNLSQNPFSGQLFSCFFAFLTPPNTFDPDHLGLFCSPRVVQHISNQQKVWCHILKWIWKELV